MYFDGSVKDGKGYWTFKLENALGICQHEGYIGEATSTQAEYAGLINGLIKAISLGISELEIRGDSQTVFHQVLGKSRVDNNHKVWKQDVIRLLDLMPVYTLRQIPRKENEAHVPLERLEARVHEPGMVATA